MPPLVRPAVTLFVVLTLLTGVAYPLAVTALSQLAFAHQAAGSLVSRDGQVVGSSLIGQNFSAARYFWGRPSATSPMPYNGANSGGSNLGPANPDLTQAVRGRIDALRRADPTNAAPIPVDLVTASASGLDPEISIAAAQYQVARVARARGAAPSAVLALVARHTTPRLFGLVGEPRVNVLGLDLDLDATFGH